MSDFNIEMHSWKLLKHYAEKMKIEEDNVEMLSEIVSSIKEILLRNKVREQSIKWDNTGARLKDGEVLLPDGMEKVIKEIIVDNELYNLFIPQKYGGMGFSPLLISPIVDLLSQFDLSLQIATTISLSVLEPLMSNYKPEFDDVIQKFAKGATTGYVAFTEAGAGSNLEAVKATSELDGDDYVLNGTKIFISNGGFAKTGLFLARNMENGREKGTNVLLVDTTDGLTTERLEEKSGIHANPTAQLHFDNVRIPKENIIGSTGDGYKKVLERLMGMRLGVSFQAIGTAKRAYELAKSYANTREQYNRTIINFPQVSDKIKNMEIQIPRMEDYTYRAAFGIDRYQRNWIPMDVGAGAKNVSEKMAAKMLPGVVRGGIAHYFISSAKLYTTEIANALLYDAQQIFGGNGFVSENEINKISRDVRVLSVYEGTSEVHSWIINKAKSAVSMVPKFKYPYAKYEDSTIYEKILFARFPQLNKIL